MKRTLFNLSNEKLLTCNMGELIPIFIHDVNPGEIFRHSTSLLVRTQPLLAPVMHKVDASIHHWFVPLRILWEDFEPFINGGEDGQQAPTYPTITLPASNPVGSLADYLGLSPEAADGVVSALPFRAYNLIYNEWYRDQQLQTSLALSIASGADTTTSTTLKNGCWSKDYFTSARPEPQLGTEVSIPLTGNAPVDLVPSTTSTNFNLVREASDDSLETSADVQTGTDGRLSNAGGTGLVLDPNGRLEADLSSVSAVDINDLRTASAAQRFKEKMNRGGARYVEYLQSMFGVRSQDSRLQLPEYLGGGNVTIQFSEVLQTAEGTDPVGELRGHGIAAGKSNRYKYMCPEHGFIVSTMVVRPKTVYAQGMHKLWNRRSPYDYLIPDFANLGDQAIQNKEIYADAASPDDTFGYTNRYDEYRYIPNTIAGEFRTTLDFWHMARIFASEPALNSSFVESDPTDRIYATTADQLQIRAMHRIKAKRPLPKTPTPRLL